MKDTNSLEIWKKFISDEVNNVLLTTSRCIFHHHWPLIRLYWFCFFHYSNCGLCSTRLSVSCEIVLLPNILFMCFDRVSNQRCKSNTSVTLNRCTLHHSTTHALTIISINYFIRSLTLKNHNLCFEVFHSESIM